MEKTKRNVINKHYMGIVFNSEAACDEFKIAMKTAHELKDKMDALPSNDYSDRNILQYKLRCVIVNPLIALINSRGRYFRFNKRAEDFLSRLGKEMNVDYLELLKEYRLVNGLNETYNE